MAGEVEQLELRLDEVLADIAAAGGADDVEDEPASAKAPEVKARCRGRKPLPDSLPRRDVEHLPAEGCTCRACGGALRKVGEDVTEILEYRPGRFEVVRHVRPALIAFGAQPCWTCEAMTQAPIPHCRSSVAGRARRWPAGLASRPRWQSRWPRSSVVTPCPAPASTPTAHRCRCSRPGAAGRRRRGSGPICAMTDNAAGAIRPRCSTSSRRTGRASIRTDTCRTSRACCRPTPVPGSTRSTRAGTWSKPRAGRMRGAIVTTSRWRTAIIYTLVGTAETNGWDPQAHLRLLLDRIADHPINRIGELAPWNLRPATA